MRLALPLSPISYHLPVPDASAMTATEVLESRGRRGFFHDHLTQMSFDVERVAIVASADETGALQYTVEFRCGWRVSHRVGPVSRPHELRDVLRLIRQNPELRRGATVEVDAETEALFANRLGGLTVSETVEHLLETERGAARAMPHPVFRDLWFVPTLREVALLHRTGELTDRQAQELWRAGTLHG